MTTVWGDYPAYPPETDPRLKMFLEALRKKVKEIQDEVTATTVTVEKNDGVVVAVCSTLDFSTQFNVTEGPTGEANISIVTDQLVKLNEIANPDGDKTFNMTTRKLSFLWTNPGGNPLELEASGAYTGALLHIHQHTGNPGATRLIEVEATDSDVIHALSVGAAGSTIVWCHKVTGDSYDRYVSHSDGKLEWGPGNAALDTNLYRSAANTLRMDKNLIVGWNLLVDIINEKTAAAGVTIDTDVKIKDGVLYFDAGSGFDTNLYRSAANVLKTDDSFVIAGSYLQINSGYVTIDRTGDAATSELVIARDAGQYGFVNFFTGATVRWRTGVSNSAEPGSDVGSDFSIWRYSDAGAYLSVPLGINRATGNVTLAHALTVTGNINAGNYILWSGDTNLYRSAANTLKTDDAVVIGSGLQVLASGIQVTGGVTVLTGGVSINAGNLTVTTGYLRVDGGTLYVDTIVEDDWDQGVTVEDVLLKDGNITAASLQVSKGGLYVDTPWLTGLNLSSGVNQMAIGATGTVGIGFYTNNTCRLWIDSSSPKLWFGDTQFAADTNLYRSAANQLKTDDEFVANAGVTSYGQIQYIGTNNNPLKFTMNDSAWGYISWYNATPTRKLYFGPNAAMDRAILGCEAGLGGLDIAGGDLAVNSIKEYTAGSGVTVEGVVLRDYHIEFPNVAPGKGIISRSLITQHVFSLGKGYIGYNSVDVSVDRFIGCDRGAATVTYSNVTGGSNLFAGDYDQAAVVAGSSIGTITIDYDGFPGYGVDNATGFVYTDGAMVFYWYFVEASYSRQPDNVKVEYYQYYGGVDQWRTVYDSAVDVGDNPLIISSAYGNYVKKVRITIDNTGGTDPCRICAIKWFAHRANLATTDRKPYFQSYYPYTQYIAGGSVSFRNTSWVETILLNTGNGIISAYGLTLTGGQHVARSSATSSIILGGGIAGTDGAFIQLFGGSHATQAGDLVFGVWGAGTKLQYDHNVAKWIFADGASMEIDAIDEATLDAGVTIDGVWLKDASVYITGGLTDTRVLDFCSGRAIVKYDGGSNLDLIGGSGKGVEVYVNTSTLAVDVDTAGIVDFPVSVKVDTVAEHTEDAGVTIDGVLLKDSKLGISFINPGTFLSGAWAFASPGSVTLQGSTYLSAGGGVYTDSVYEKTAGAGVAIDGVVIRDGAVVIRGAVTPSTGIGMELEWDGTQSDILSYDRDTPAYKPLRLRGSKVTLNEDGTDVLWVDGFNVGIRGTSTLTVDNIIETTEGEGVTIESVLLKDSGVILPNTKSYKGKTAAGTAYNLIGTDASNNIDIGNVAFTGEIAFSINSVADILKIQNTVVTSAVELVVAGEFTAYGATTETATGRDEVRIGTVGGTPRVIFEDNSYTQWEIDNSLGTFRIYNPGTVRLTISNAGLVTIPGSIVIGAGDPGGSSVLRVYNATDYATALFYNPTNAAQVEVTAAAANKHAVLRASSGGGTGYPKLVLYGNYLKVIEGGAASADAIFGFYSVFSSARTYDTVLRIYGSAASSWGTYLQLKHDGTDGVIGTDTGDILLDPASGYVEVDGVVDLNARSTSRLVLPVGTDKWAT